MMRELSIDKAIIWMSKRSRLENLDPHNYRISYFSLCKLFESYVRPSDYETMSAGALAVYGWMPTILKKMPNIDQWRLHRATLDKLRTAKKWKQIYEVINANPELLKLINNSVVGTSKFLHFLNPRVFPIWDSRIARCAGLKSRYQCEKINNYLSYSASLNALLEDEIRLPKHYSKFVGEVSPIRSLEALLFFYGGRK